MQDQRLFGWIWLAWLESVFVRFEMHFDERLKNESVFTFFTPNNCTFSCFQIKEPSLPTPLVQNHWIFLAKLNTTHEHYMISSRNESISFFCKRGPGKSSETNSARDSCGQVARGGSDLGLWSSKVEFCYTRGKFSISLIPCCQKTILWKKLGNFH